MLKGAGLLAAAMAVAVAAQGRAATTVDDDHGTGLEATLLPIGQPLAGTLSDADDVDAFRIDLTGAARVEVRTSGGTDTRGRLLDSSGGVRARDDDSGPGGHNFRIVAALEPDVYYLEVEGAAGDYSVVAVLADAPDQGDTARASTPLALHDEALLGGAPKMLLGASGRIWPSVADVDAFRLDVPFATSVTVRSSGSKALRARLVDSSLATSSDDTGEDIGTDPHGNLHIRRWLAAGTYYVVVGGDEVGAYRLLATRGRGPSCWNARLTLEPGVASPRDQGSSPETSTRVTVGGPPTPGTIADDADVDFFRLDLQGNALVDVYTSGSASTRGELYDVRGALIAADEGSGPGGRNFRIERELATGIYYIAVKGAPGARGGYALSARTGGAFDHPDALRIATRLPLHDTLDLARATPDMRLGTAGRIWPSAADVDAFRLDVARDGTVVRVRTSGGTALYARLVHAGEPSVEIASDDSGGDISLEAPLDAGVYYLVVGGHETGAYRLLARGHELGDAPPDKAAFDALVRGKTLSAAHLEAVRFRPARRFTGTLKNAHRGGRYTYERHTCRDLQFPPASLTGWLDLEYDDGGRCTVVLDFRDSNSGSASFCDDAAWTRSDFWLLYDDEVVHIPDPELLRDIRWALRKWYGEPLTVRDMASLTSLRVGWRVRDLAGLEHATGLTVLVLESNQIADLSPLAALPALTYLSFSYSAVSDLSPLAGLTGLRTLDISHNPGVSDLSPLAGLIGLENLDLSDNPGITDLSPLAGLSGLRSLDLSDNPGISDRSPLAGLGALTELDLSDSLVSDLSWLAAMTALTDLHLRRNRIRELSPLSGLAALSVLDLSRNDVSDLSPLAESISLTTLRLAFNDVSDLSPLSGLAALSELDLSRNRGLSNLKPLAALAALKGLDLSDNQGISDVSPLAGLTALERLNLWDNDVADVSPLAGLTALQRLDLSYNRISDLSPLSGLTALRELYASNNRIADVSSLAGGLAGRHLFGLNLSHNRIRDVSPLAGLASVSDFLGLAGNLISDVSPLTALGVRGLDLSRLDLSHNEIVELTDLPGFSWLDLSGNRIADLTPLLPYLSFSLNVEANAITSLPPTRSLQWALYLGGNAVTDIRPLVERSPGYGNYDDVEDFTVSVWRNPGGAADRLRDLGVHVVGDSHLVPFLVDPLGDPRRRPFVRLVSLRGADAWFYAAGSGPTARPAGVVVRDRFALHVDATDIAGGNRRKRVYGQVPLRPDTALEVYSAGVRAYTYMRNPDGFLTAMHDIVPRSRGRHQVPLFHPADSEDGTGVLRLVNVGATDAEVSIEGIDDAGVRHGPVDLVLHAGTATVLTSRGLESGTGAGLSGGLGDGTGTWRLVVSSAAEIAVMSLYHSPTGHLTNLSTTARDNVVPLLLRASDPFRQGVVRIANGGDAATDVQIRGIDDAGAVFGPVTVSVAARAAIHFNSHDWEHGNAATGLSNGVGTGTGDWRLHVTGGADIQVSAYVETGDGFLSSVHDVAPGACAVRRHPHKPPPPQGPVAWAAPVKSRWLCRSLPEGVVGIQRSISGVRFSPGTGTDVIATFNPASSDDHVSSLRLVNDGDDHATVTILGYDDRGNWAGPVKLEVAAGGARNVTSQELEGGGDGLSGALGDGAGMWELVVTYSGGPVAVVHLLESPSGYITNLSTAPHHGIVGDGQF